MNNKKYIIGISILATIFLIILIIFIIINPNDNTPPDNRSEELKNNELLYELTLIDNETEKYYAITNLTSNSRIKTSISFPDTIDNIPVKKIISTNTNFSEYHNVIDITIGKNITYIGTSLNDSKLYNMPFLEATKLKKFEVHKDNPFFASRNGILYDKTYQTLIKFPLGLTIEEQKYTITDGVTTIGDYAFTNNKRLDEINFNSELTTIGIKAFANCSNLTKINFSQAVNLKTIDNFAFSNLENIINITLPNSLTTIGTCTFSECNRLIEIYIPNTVINFGERILNGSSFCIVTTSSDNLNFLKSQSAKLGITTNIDTRIIAK